MVIFLLCFSIKDRTLLLIYSHRARAGCRVAVSLSENTRRHYVGISHYALHIHILYRAGVKAKITVRGATGVFSCLYERTWPPELSLTC